MLFCYYVHELESRLWSVAANRLKAGLVPAGKLIVNYVISTGQEPHEMHSREKGPWPV